MTFQDQEKKKFGTHEPPLRSLNTTAPYTLYRNINRSCEVWQETKKYTLLFISLHFDALHVAALHTIKRSSTLLVSALSCHISGYKCFENTKCLHLRGRAQEINSGSNKYLPAQPQSAILSAENKWTNYSKRVF
jgi:hypothetical protein